MNNSENIRYIVFDSLTGGRLCKDFKIRGFANFDTGKSCVKIYKLWGAASNTVRKLNRSADKKRFKIIPLRTDESMDASGHIEKIDG